MQGLGCRLKNVLDHDGVEMIRFNFAGDASTGYTHRLDTYMSLLF
jgi:hypothetical protein